MFRQRERTTLDWFYKSVDDTQIRSVSEVILKDKDKYVGTKPSQNDKMHTACA